MPNISKHKDESMWVKSVLLKYNVRRDVIALLMKHGYFTIKDKYSTNGGGVTHWATPPEKIWVELYTKQDEACIHECAHAYRVYLITYQPEKWDRIKARLITQFLKEADINNGEYTHIRDLCRVYKYGMNDWEGMWVASSNMWNESEIWAGLASGSMGDMNLFPDSLITGIYDRFYLT